MAKPEAKKKKTTPKDLPGSGLARGAGDAIKKRQDEMAKRMKEIFGK
jgi:hypothetical protein